MRILLLLLILLPSIVFGQTREEEVKERINYFRSNPIFITQFTLNQKSIKGLSAEEIEIAKREIANINKNIRAAFTTFWDINDTIIFVPDIELKAKKKEFKGGIFFELFKISEYTNAKGKIIPVTAFALSRPNKADYFKNVVSRKGIDTSFVNIATEVRQLKLNVTTGEVINKRDLGIKIILINKDDQINDFGESYVNLIRSKYEGNFIEVDNNFIEEIIINRDPKYIYLMNGSTFNAEDGTLIPLY